MRPLAALLAVFVLALGLPAGALAHGDGPTHYLESVDLYPGFSPPPTTAVELQLMGFVEAARRGGVPVKAALANTGDVTDRPAVLRSPQAFAEDVAATIGARVPVILVTPYGVGVAGASVPDVALPRRASSDRMAVAAMEAIRAVAHSSGHPLPADVPPASLPPAIAATELGTSPDSGSSGWLPLGVFAAVFGGLALIFEARARLLRRRRPEPTSPTLMVTEGP